MPKVSYLNKNSEPARDNTIMDQSQINTKPVYVNKKLASEIFGVSKSTIYKWCDEAQETGHWKDLVIRPSATVTLIHLETMEEYLKSRNKHFL